MPVHNYHVIRKTRNREGKPPQVNPEKTTRFGMTWVVMNVKAGLGACHKPLKVGVEVAKIAKQGLEFAGFGGVAQVIKLALIPCMAARSLYFVFSSRFSVDATKLNSPEDRRNLTISFLSMTTLISPVLQALDLRGKEEIEYLLQAEIGFLKIFSFEESLVDFTKPKEEGEDLEDKKVPFHVRLLDAIKGTCEVTTLFLYASQTPNLIVALGAISFTIGVYNLSYPLIEMAAKMCQKA